MDSDENLRQKKVFILGVKAVSWVWIQKICVYGLISFGVLSTGTLKMVYECLKMQNLVKSGIENGSD